MNTKLVLTLITGSIALAAGNLSAQTTPGPQPAMCLRACWVARAPHHACATMTALTRMIVHHTAASSHWGTTSQSTSAGMVRALQNYDIDVDGFCDIEYHWMIDKLGNIFECRINAAGNGLTKGAHDGTNDKSHGASLMGYFHPPYNHVAPQVMLDQLYALTAWRMPSGWSPYGAGTYNGVTVGFLDGHKKVKATACPGDNIHPNLITEDYNGGTMRTSVANRRGGAVNNAATVSRSVPGSVTAGSTFSATITMNNNGTKAWLDVTYHALGSQNPQDNGTWGLSRVGVAGTVNPGSNKAFTFNATAPVTPGTYAFDWKMLEEGVQWFGATSTGNINVTAPVSEVIVDNVSAGFSVVGAGWATASSSTDKYGADYRYHSTAAVSEPAQWLATVSGTKTVSAWWPQGGNRSVSAAYHVYHSGGTSVVPVNQQGGGGTWNSLGSFNMTTGKVQLSVWTATGYIVVADAIRWQ